MVTDWIRLLRPAQWVKNLFVLAPLVFSLKLADEDIALRGALAFAVFCVASSAGYVANDLADIERDRLHPVKRRRPLAAGRVSPASARILAVVLAVTALAASVPVGRGLVVCVAAFLLLQALYSVVLKGIPVADVVSISLGFVLRTLAGAVAVGAQMSPWLFISTFLLAMFLALGKRRSELAMLGEKASGHREVLDQYDPRLLDAMIAFSSAGAVGVYILYALAPEVAERLGTGNIYWTVPFVVFGVFRYLFLVYAREQGGSPTAVLLGDRILQVTMAGWAATVFLLLYG